MKATIAHIIDIFTLPPQTPFLLDKLGFEGVSFTRSCFHDALALLVFEFSIRPLISLKTKRARVFILFEVSRDRFSDRPVCNQFVEKVKSVSKIVITLEPYMIA